jgi:hypothetical protein
MLTDQREHFIKNTARKNAYRLKIPESYQAAIAVKTFMSSGLTSECNSEEAFVPMGISTTVRFEQTTFGEFLVNWQPRCIPGCWWAEVQSPLDPGESWGMSASRMRTLQGRMSKEEWKESLSFYVLQAGMYLPEYRVESVEEWIESIESVNFYDMAMNSGPDYNPDPSLKTWYLLSFP